MNRLRLFLTLTCGAALAMSTRADDRQTQGAMLGVDLVKTALSAKASDFVEIHGNTVGSPGTELEFAL